MSYHKNQDGGRRPSWKSIYLSHNILRYLIFIWFEVAELDSGISFAVWMHLKVILGELYLYCQFVKSISRQKYQVLRYNWYEGPYFFLLVINIAKYVYMIIESVSIPTPFRTKYMKSIFKHILFPLLRTRGAIKMPSLVKIGIDLEMVFDEM